MSALTRASNVMAPTKRSPQRWRNSVGYSAFAEEQICSSSDLRETGPEHVAATVPLLPRAKTRSVVSFSPPRGRVATRNLPAPSWRSRSSSSVTTKARPPARASPVSMQRATWTSADRTLECTTPDGSVRSRASRSVPSSRRSTSTQRIRPVERPGRDDRPNPRVSMSWRADHREPVRARRDTGPRCERHRHLFRVLRGMRGRREVSLGCELHRAHASPSMLTCEDARRVPSYHRGQ